MWIVELDGTDESKSRMEESEENKMEFSDHRAMVDEGAWSGFNQVRKKVSKNG